MENTVKDQAEQSEARKSLRERTQDYGNKLANNVRLIDLYARLKDYYKGFEIAALGLTSALGYWGTSKGANQSNEFNQKLGGAFGDLLFVGSQGMLSYFSAWAEKNQVLRVYSEIANNELKNKPKITFEDLKTSKNPMVREAALYYSKKSFIRSATDIAGLTRIIPTAFYIGEKMLGSDSLLKKENAFGKVLGAMYAVKGIPMLMAAKAGYFQWYFSSRQTGSFYESKNIWNKTEGITHIPNRALNENVQAGEFVTQQDIRSLYVNFREENPKLSMAEFTQDDPLASRIFEQTARYMNHTYAPKLFKINERNKQMDLPQKYLSHAMLVELVGSGGLRVEDALGSAIRLEVLATHGRKGVKHGIKKYREVCKILENIPHPHRADFTSQSSAIEATRDYLQKMDEIGREYLDKLWPPQYINNEIKEGLILSIFEGATLSQDKIDYMASALFMRENTQNKTYRPAANDPASVFNESKKEQAAEDQREAEHRKRFATAREKKTPKTSFTDKLQKRDAATLLEHPRSAEAEPSSAVRA